MTRPPPVMALDIDLRSIYCWCSECGLVANSHENLAAVKIHIAGHALHRPTVLVEVASAKDYTDDKAVAYNKRRWTIWNVAATEQLYRYMMSLGLHERMRVAPSSVWTHGHEVKTRHLLTGADAKNKDLKECQSMVWFHRHSPEDWVPWPQFLDSL